MEAFTIYNLDGFSPEVQVITNEYLEASTGGSLEQFEAAETKFYVDMEDIGAEGDVLYSLEMELGM
ncbi:hypothetical protein kac65v162_gp184 [Nodularia phage vB_NspS-kac65v162]|jgi:uncharacterized protein (DUF427 family)|uniref:Uncharacterized protein n=3 Tax=Ravarandavirus kac65v151 TaxID=2845689 RepID=A0A482MJC6_9CAUD|nr:hypothetical protein HWC12_gp133 [Nodularia phage vB_NspS-kac65v151]QBQ73214.1 hypothetical protein kac65v151_gp184 [Nodularia phage vB_NspS-kac65v151]QBQ73422.1 hypothetical protein kac65v161_gp184 [Nodularia phage vB_NspS-kac65v161]QBQ73628.1 hypothetical protein kac65v162_gp184 [Nodularia phage vB_NspS-kac65v162]